MTPGDTKFKVPLLYILASLKMFPTLSWYYQTPSGALPDPGFAFLKCLHKFKVSCFYKPG